MIAPCLTRRADNGAVASTRSGKRPGCAPVESAGDMDTNDEMQRSSVPPSVVCNETKKHAVVRCVSNADAEILLAVLLYSDLTSVITETCTCDMAHGTGALLTRQGFTSPINPFPTPVCFKQTEIYGAVASSPLGPPSTGSAALVCGHGTDSHSDTNYSLYMSLYRASRRPGPTPLDR